MILYGNHEAPNKVAVDILVDGEWRTFDTLKDAAAFVGVSVSTIGVHIRKEKPCRGYLIKRHEQQGFC